MPVGRTRRALGDHAERNRQPYDGVTGLPPEWLPGPLVHEFLCIREQLLDAHPVERVREWFAAYRVRMEPVTNMRGVPRIPREVLGALEALAYIAALVGLGKERGLRAYLGRGTETVLRKTAVSESDRARRRLGNMISATVRGERVRARDERIHAAIVAATPAKRIAADEQVSVSTVSRSRKRLRR